MQNLRYEWLERLSILSSEDWDSLKLRKSFFHEILWWNHRWYLGNTVDMTNFKRKFGGVRNGTGRFDLSEHPVSYWAGDYSIGLCETNPELRNDEDLTFEKMTKAAGLENHLDYPVQRRIIDSTPLLDLSQPSSFFYEKIENHGLIVNASSFFNEFVISRSISVYPVTQAISEIAHSHGLGGIVYESVRQPNDAIPCPSKCVVVYDDNYLAKIQPVNKSFTANEH